MSVERTLSSERSSGVIVDRYLSVVCRADDKVCVRRLEGTAISIWEIETSIARRLRKSGNSGRASTLSVITGRIVTTGRKVSVLEREAMRARQRLSCTLTESR